MPEYTLTPIEQSRADTGYRFYRVEPSTYDQLSAGVDQARGYPVGQPSKAVTVKGLLPREMCPIATDGSGYVLCQIDCWRFTPQDDAMMEPAAQAGLLEELTVAQFLAIKPLEEIS